MQKMIDGKIEAGGIGIVIGKITEIEFVVTATDLEMLSKRMNMLRTGDSARIFSADGEFEGKPVRFIIRMKQ